MKIVSCRLCGGKLKIILPLGNIPLVNYFPKASEIKKEIKYPLNFCVCTVCELAQLNYIVPPKNIFKSYHYVNGTSKPLVDHLTTLARVCIKDFKINKKNKVLDIGTNDGTLLEPFIKKGVSVTAVEPAKTISEIARAKGINVISEFFNNKLAKKILKMNGKFNLIFATHVLANIVDLHDFIEGVKLLLADDGKLIIEVGSLKKMMRAGKFDSIYHEHYSYFSFKTLKRLLNEHDLTIVDAKENLFHGGSIRITAKHASSSVLGLKFDEKIRTSDFTRFVSLAKTEKNKILKLFKSINKKTVIGFGAPAKGVILLNYCRLDSKKIKFIVDSTPIKQNKFIPGVHIPIYAEDYMQNEDFDYCLILAWNYKGYILKKLKRSKKHFSVIIPFPKLEIIKI